MHPTQLSHVKISHRCTLAQRWANVLIPTSYRSDCQWQNVNVGAMLGQRGTSNPNHRPTVLPYTNVGPTWVQRRSQKCEKFKDDDGRRTIAHSSLRLRWAKKQSHSYTSHSESCAHSYTSRILFFQILPVIHILLGWKRYPIDIFLKWKWYPFIYSEAWKVYPIPGARLYLYL